MQAAPTPLTTVHPGENLKHRPSNHNFSQASSFKQPSEENTVHVCDPVAREGIRLAHQKLDEIMDLLQKINKKWLNT